MDDRMFGILGQTVTDLTLSVSKLEEKVDTTFDRMKSEISPVVRLAVLEGMEHGFQKHTDACAKLSLDPMKADIKEHTGKLEKINLRIAAWAGGLGVIAILAEEIIRRILK